LQQRISSLEAELSESRSRLQRELMDATNKHAVEKKSLEDQINEHARTICAMEDRLDKITNKAKEYQAEITTLRATVDGEHVQLHRVFITLS
jgi:uncharacterized coiled-coil DUF342 family protein